MSISGSGIEPPTFSQTGVRSGVAWKEGLLSTVLIDGMFLIGSTPKTKTDMAMSMQKQQTLQKNIFCCQQIFIILRILPFLHVELTNTEITSLCTNDDEDEART